MLLNLLNKHFPPSNQFHKIFNRNTVKVSYSCTENISSIIRSHNKKVTSKKPENSELCNCIDKNECPLENKCLVENTIYKCTVTTSKETKIYMGTAEGNFKKRFYNHKKSFKNKKYSNHTTLSKYIWDTKEKHQETPTLKWSIVKQVPSYLNITKKCLLCLHEKFEILNYPNPVETLNNRSELVSKCRHSNKYLLKNFISND